MKTLLIISGALLLYGIVGHFDQPEDHSFPLSAKQQREIIGRLYK